MPEARLYYEMGPFSLNKMCTPDTEGKLYCFPGHQKQGKKFLSDKLVQYELLRTRPKWFLSPLKLGLRKHPGMAVLPA